MHRLAFHPHVIEGTLVPANSFVGPHHENMIKPMLFFLQFRSLPLAVVHDRCRCWLRCVGPKVCKRAPAIAYIYLPVSSNHRRRRRRRFSSELPAKGPRVQNVGPTRLQVP